MLDLDDFSGAFASNNNNNNSNHDPWGSSANGKASHNNNSKFQEDTDSDDFFPPIKSTPGPQNGKQGAILDDPWATPLPPFNKPAVAAAVVDPWKNAASANPHTSNQTNPWLPTQNMTATSPVAKDPWATTNVPNSAAKADDFDIFTSNRVGSPTVTTPATKIDPFGDFFGSNPGATESSTNPWNANANSMSVGGNAKLTNEKPPVSSSSKQPVNDSSIRKTPESFLGENSSLVNLENLIPTRPKSTNPFGDSSGGGAMRQMSGGGMSTSTSIGQLNNPFLAQQGKQELRFSARITFFLLLFRVENTCKILRF